MMTWIRGAFLARAPMVAALVATFIGCTPAQRTAAKNAWDTAGSIVANCTTDAWDAGSKVADLVHEGPEDWQSRLMHVLADLPAIGEAAYCVIKAVEQHMHQHATDCAGDQCVAAAPSPQLQAEIDRYQKVKAVVQALTHPAVQR